MDSTFLDNLYSEPSVNQTPSSQIDWNL